MKVLLIALVVLMLSACAVFSDVPTVGDSVERARELLGEPDGYIKTGAYELLVYERGRVEVRDGVVSKIKLMSAEEAAVARAEKERERQARLAMELKRREQLRARGERIRDEMLMDPAFLAKPAGDQLAFWTTFLKKYPGVEIDPAYRADLIARHTQELKEAATEQRLREMENRVAAAEARAARAEQDAADARRRSNSYVSYGYPVVRYRSPVVVTPAPYYYGPSRTTTVRKRPPVTSTVGPCTGRSIFAPNQPYVYTPSYSWLGRYGTSSRTQSRSSSGVHVRAKVSF